MSICGVVGLVLLEMMEERDDGVVVVSFVDVVVDVDDVVCCATLLFTSHDSHCMHPSPITILPTSPLREIISNQLLLHR